MGDFNLVLCREAPTPNFTVGSIYSDKGFICHSLEDVVREKTGVPVQQWKIKGKTAIPYGRYQIEITMSQRFQKPLPLLLDVRGFEGVRIHSGNTEADTEGCILVGMQKTPNGIAQSRDAFKIIYSQIQEQLDDGNSVWITIKPAAR